jgi:hypothetical protein
MAEVKKKREPVIHARARGHRTYTECKRWNESLKLGSAKRVTCKQCAAVLRKRRLIWLAERGLNIFDIVRRSA